MDQSLALEIMLSGYNVFLTGAAGSGKTHTLDTFIRLAKKQKKHLAVTATTGLAATHLSGNTIHSWSGLGASEDIPYLFFEKMPTGRINQIQKADILIIDEISMLHDFRLDLINLICQQVRDTFTKPFGGLQVILSGDFFQLPPINRPDSKQGGFAPHAKSWSSLDPVVCYLDSQHRQNDAAYLEILNALRLGDLRRHHVEKLLSRLNSDLDPDHSITELHTTNFNVDRLNHSRLTRLSTPEHNFTATSTGSANYLKNLKRSCLTPELLRLKTGALVIATKNHANKKYANGSIGTVVDFDQLGQPLVEFKNGHLVTMAPDTWELRDGHLKRASLTQIPLRLAWAITIHKSQGMTLDAAKIDLRRAFEPGMGYVALSRVKSLSALSLLGLNKMALQISPAALELDSVFRKNSARAVRTYSHLLEKSTIAAIENAKPQKKPKDSARSSAYQIRIAKLREIYPNARLPWTLKDSLELVELYLKGKTPQELSIKFGRKPRAIMLRLNMCFDAEIFIEDEIQALS